MTDTIQFLLRHGYALLFAWVLVEQLGLPIPSIPLLLAAGALAGVGRLSAATTVLLALAASVLADVSWYEVGRRRGGRILRLLCRISLEPDSCVRRTENIFDRYGARSLLVAKFVPGLNTAAAPMAGMTGMSLPRFLLFDLLGALLWSGTSVAVGFVFAGQIARLADGLARLGHWLLALLLIAALAVYIARRWSQRRHFHQQLLADRITPEEVKQKLEAGEPLTIVDLRHPLDFLPYPQLIPGALRLAPEELAARLGELPRDRELILYCT